MEGFSGHFHVCTQLFLVFSDCGVNGAMGGLGHPTVLRLNRYARKLAFLRVIEAKATIPISINVNESGKGTTDVCGASTFRMWGLKSNGTKTYVSG